MITSQPPRRAVAALFAVAAALGVTGCQTDGPQPISHVTCRPGSITIDLTNTGDRSARYTVTVAIKSAGTTFSVQYSSNAIEPGKTGRVTDDRPDDDETCTVTKVEVFS